MKSNYIYFKSILVENINLHRRYIGPLHQKIDINTSIYIILIYTILYFLIGARDLRDMYEVSNELGYTNNIENDDNQQDYIPIYEILANSLET